MAQDYKIEIVKGDKVIPVEETGIGREGEHPNIVIREMQKKERELNRLLSNPAASLKGKNK
jgi:hypothetical protein